MGFSSLIPGRPLWTALPAVALALPLLSQAPAPASPVICTTTLEAPSPGSFRSGSAPAGPVEVTRCGAVLTTGELVDRRAFSYRAPFARGVSLSHQISDVLGLAIPGREGGKIVAFGFPDQAIVWDGSAIQNTYQALLEEQSPVIPWRSGDLPNQFGTSLQPGISQAMGNGPGQPPLQAQPPFIPTQPFQQESAPVRGLW
jgi:hypothetical protein